MQPRTLELQPVTVEEIESWARPRTSEQLGSFVARLTAQHDSRIAEEALLAEVDDLELAA